MCLQELSMCFGGHGLVLAFSGIGIIIAVGPEFAGLGEGAENNSPRLC